MAHFTRTSGDFVQYVGVNTSIGRLQTATGKPMRGSDVSVSYLEGNSQDGTLTFAAFGSVSAPNLAIDGPRLSGAHLPLTTVTLDVVNPQTGEPTGQSFPVQVEVTWTGTGDLTIGHFTSRYPIPGIGMELTRGNGMTRPATAVADTLTFTKPDGTDVTLSGATDESAGLSNSRFMDIFISHQPEG